MKISTPIIIRNLLIIQITACICMPDLSYGAGKSRKRSRYSGDSQLLSIKKKYHDGDINKQELWKGIEKIPSKSLSPSKLPIKKQIQAQVLKEEGYEIIASIYASQAIRYSKKPSAPQLDGTWKLLAEISEKKPIQYVLEDLAQKIGKKIKTPKYIGNNWNYIVGMSLLDRGKTKLALKYLSSLKMKDKYYLL